jgi:hypothetical protein
VVVVNFLNQRNEADLRLYLQTDLDDQIRARLT